MLKSRYFSILLALLFVAFSVTPGTAQDEFTLTATLHAHPKQENLAVIAATLTPQPGWYAYAPDPDNPLVRPPDLGIVVAGKPLASFYPAGTSKPDPTRPGEQVKIYDNPVSFFLTLPRAMAQGDILGRFTAVLCDGQKCILPRQPITLTAPAGSMLPPLPPDLQQTFLALEAATTRHARPATPPAQSMPTGPDEQWSFTPRPFSPALEVTGLFSAICLGLLAGLILNVMPCVLPVVSLKISALLSSAGETNKRRQQRSFREHNTFFGLGIMLWFAFLAALLGLGDLAWGVLFQSPWVIGTLAALLLLLALSLFGLFHLPVIDLKFDQSIHHPRRKALATGMLTTLLATPCSGPLLGGVLGWALLRPGSELAIVFTAIGLGMASPYFLMALFPGLVRFFPKPGAWLVHVEKGVALFLLAAVIYLLSLLPTFSLAGFPLPHWLAAGWCLGTGIWLWRVARHNKFRLFLCALALGLTIGGPVLFFMPADLSSPWTNFAPKPFKQELGNKLMVLDFTANWCPTCKVLEATVLTNEAVQQWSSAYSATFIRVDLSEHMPRSEALLKELGSQSIPLVALFPAGKTALSPIIIRDLFTAGQLTQALEQAHGESTQQ